MFHMVIGIFPLMRNHLVVGVGREKGYPDTVHQLKYWSGHSQLFFRYHLLQVNLGMASLLVNNNGDAIACIGFSENTDSIGTF